MKINSPKLKSLKPKGKRKICHYSRPDKCDSKEITSMAFLKDYLRSCPYPKPCPCGFSKSTHILDTVFPHFPNANYIN
jgi:hypothetical protein